MNVQQIGFGALLVAVVLVTLALVWGPLVLLFRWKDARRLKYLAYYLAAFLINAIVMAEGSRAGSPLTAPLVVLAWIYVVRVWRARRAPFVLAAAEEAKP
jgi:hypothetical protein